MTEKSLTIEDFNPSQLNPVHDQEDEANRQKAILIARFHAELIKNGVPESISEDLVKMRFETMLMGLGESISEFDLSDFDDD